MENPSQILLPVLVRHHSVRQFLALLYQFDSNFFFVFVWKGGEFKSTSDVCSQFSWLLLFKTKKKQNKTNKDTIKICLSCVLKNKMEPHKSASRHSNLVIIFLDFFFFACRIFFFSFCQILRLFSDFFFNHLNENGIATRLFFLLFYLFQDFRFEKNLVVN